MICYCITGSSSVDLKWGEPTSLIYRTKLNMDFKLHLKSAINLNIIVVHVKKSYKQLTTSGQMAVSSVMS